MKRHPSTGSTLIEMAVVLLILSLLAGSLGMGLANHLARRAEGATDDALAEARDTLLGYAMRKGNFPCPARSAQDGAEDRNDSTCGRHATACCPGPPSAYRVWTDGPSVCVTPSPPHTPGKSTTSRTAPSRSSPATWTVPNSNSLPPAA